MPSTKPSPTALGRAPLIATRASRRIRSKKGSEETFQRNADKIVVKGEKRKSSPEQSEHAANKCKKRAVTSKKNKESINPGKKRSLPEGDSVETSDKKEEINNLFFVKPSIAEEPEPSNKKLRSEATVSESSSSLVKKDSGKKGVKKYRLGPTVGFFPVKCVSQHLARADNSDEFFIIKLLKMPKDEPIKGDDIQARSLLHTEHSLLDILKHEEGVFHSHGLFRISKEYEGRLNETTRETFTAADGSKTVREVIKIYLVVDCFVNHDFSPRYTKITTLQNHLIKEKKLPEQEALRILCKTLRIVERLHQLNIVHRDLKLGNIIMNKETGEIKIADFYLGKLLLSDDTKLTDQRGSPAYISPDILIGKPYIGKPCDMWSLGIVLYTMLYGQFPFYDAKGAQLFGKIVKGKFEFPISCDVNVSDRTKKLISSLLDLDPAKRPSATQALQEVESIIQEEISLMTDPNDQAVPDQNSSIGGITKREADTLAQLTAISDQAWKELAQMLALGNMLVEGNGPSIPRGPIVLQEQPESSRPSTSTSRAALQRVQGQSNFYTLEDAQVPSSNPSQQRSINSREMFFLGVETDGDQVVPCIF